MPVDSAALLHSAVLENNEKAVRFLLKHGADANAPSCRASDETLKKLGAQTSSNQSVEMCEMFSRYRSSSFSASCSTITPNPVALAPGSSFTFSGRNRKHQQPKSLTPMHIAAANGRADIIEILVGHGGEVDATMEGDYTPLTIAVLYQHYEIVEMLANQGANVNARSRSGKTPIYFAVKGKQTAMVSLLLENGADPNLGTDHGVTPLHIAVERKLPEVVEILLKYRADVNVKTKTGVTPLHCAAVKGQTDITELILRYGGDVSVIMKKGEIDVTPLLWVTEAERNKITNVVKKYAPKSKGAGFYGTFFKKIWKQFALKKF